MSSGPPARRKYDKRGKNNKNDKEGILDSGLNRTPSDQFVLSTEVVLKPSSTELEVIKNDEESTSGASLQMGINQPMDTPVFTEVKNLAAEKPFKNFGPSPNRCYLKSQWCQTPRLANGV
jgi:hypothetical protein